ncbi:hypothetical protein BOTBODRAFT_54888 [Botryobasidium botryosum FD-172 SS1]|uniref:non-specific serine/threonine protein kinase n=1 Tax=Botryobasidium botryosum (strain FD-172 SS1) TaxID=930990 RepID=A0A067MJS5_BOTB1|nr:hypothetical protein BOTBODRAFT_54888 [Botryobasidium botryosum FD-172 SS1]
MDLPPPSIPTPPLQPAPAHAYAPSTASSSSQNDTSMPFVERHICRLASVKESCDKELKKVVGLITTYFEERLRKEQQNELELDDPLKFRSHRDDASENGGDEADAEWGRRGRKTPTTSSSPTRTQRQPILSRLASIYGSNMGSGKRSPIRSKGAPTSTSSSGQWHTRAQSAVSRYLSRNIHAAAVPIQSGSSSREASQSRSPLPKTSNGADHAYPTTSTPRPSLAHRTSHLDLRTGEPPQVDPFMVTLHEIITTATVILEMPISTLTSRPKIFFELVQKVQTIGKAWDGHPNWHGRDWYVQLLLAVASLDHVVEWWGVEDQFWNFQDKEARCFVVFIELSLGGVEIAWINQAWAVVGSFPEESVGKPVAEVLAPQDKDVFVNATRQLLEDDSHPIEVQVKLCVEPEAESNAATARPPYRSMEGKGMLMRDRVDGTPTHTMWVLKPTSPAQPPESLPLLLDGDLLSLDQVNASFNRGTDAPPLLRPISTEPIMCRICERDFPDWFFEKHSGTCNEIHQLEANIGEYSECITELRGTIHGLITSLDRSLPATVVPEYRATPIYAPTSPPSLPTRIHRDSVRKMLERLDEILQAAYEIAVPALKEEQAAEPIENQRLLSPDSVDKLERVQRWVKPVPEDAGLARLVQDAETLMRTKVKDVVKMHNTIKYMEKVRREWEEKFAQGLVVLDESEQGREEQRRGQESGSGYGHGDEREGAEGAPSSANSEYAFDGSEPTPMAPSSPGPSSSREGGEGRTLAEIPPDGTGKTVRSRQSMHGLPADPYRTLTPPSPLVRPRDARSERHSIINPIVSPPSSGLASGPLSPRISTIAPFKTTPLSIKDFEIIKPISKGAFSSIFLVKKKTTRDYFAIKVLRKDDMIAKYQITNVKTERMILMKQTESPLVVKLYFTFQSKENLYLVMEYLNGGDCAALIKSLGSLPEEWTRAYVAEVVLGLEYLHERGVVHRDVKPDNLLIDQHGHLKLIDFGLSSIGLLGRQTGDPRSNQSSLGLDRGAKRASRVPSMETPQQPSNSPLQSFAAGLTKEPRSHSNSGSRAPPPTPIPTAQKFIGTPDYLAPEIILGLGGGHWAVDWWGLGVITYEFLYGIPPFHAETHEKVFGNIISRCIEWHEEWIDMSPEARDFMDRLLTLDPTKRLGCNGAQEVKEHPFLRNVKWEEVLTQQPAFVPQTANPESTDYFDARGAIPQHFPEESPVVVLEATSEAAHPIPPPLGDALLPSHDDFGSFAFKNLHILKQANDNVVRKLQADQLRALETSTILERRRSTS